MDSLNTMRALLTVLAALSAIVLFTMEFWIPGAVMTVGVAIHTWHFWQISRSGHGHE
ncbi:MAG TPA: hypothetical protein VGA36_08175 [Nitriliruptorales bacterium]|jgi:hypothetical protein